MKGTSRIQRLEFKKTARKRKKLPKFRKYNVYVTLKFKTMHKFVIVRKRLWREQLEFKKTAHKSKRLPKLTQKIT